MGSFPHELSGYRHVSDPATREMFEKLWGAPIDAEPGLRIPNMLDAAVDGVFKGALHPGRGHPPVRPQHEACRRRPRGDGVRRRPRPLPQRDRQLRPCLPARLDLPREGRDLHQCRAAHPAGPQGDGAEERLCGLGGHAVARQGDGPRLELHPSRRDHGRDRRGDADLRRRLLRAAGRTGLDPVAVQRAGARRHAGHAHGRISCAARASSCSPNMSPTDEKIGPRYPAAAHHRPHPQPV